MVGLVLASHGEMAKGVLDTCALFFPYGISQVKALGLKQEDSVEEFEQRLLDAIREVDTGDGVLVLCDLLGGTPANCSRRIAMRTMDETIQFIAGFNLPMVLEILGARFGAERISQMETERFLEAGTQGIVSLNRQLEREDGGTEDDFFQ